MKAVIPAAGLGTRFLPYTKAQPKEMIPVVDKPAIQYVVEEAVESGLQDILIVTGRGKRAIEDHFDVNVELEGHLERAGKPEALEDLRRLIRASRIMYVRQPAPRGLGDAVLHARAYVDGEPFAVLLGDDLTFDPPCTRVLRDAYSRLGATVLAVQSVPREDIGRYGMVVGRPAGPGVVRVEDIIEKPSPSEAGSDLATIGRYILSPSIFEALEATGPGRGSEVQLTDAIRALLKREDVYGLVYSGRRYDVGDKVGWLCANLDLAAKRPEFRPRLSEWVAQVGPSLAGED
jgi:UTP--glucose-1-phosphate uridylyltransferase